ncbi:MAG: TrkA family potassium uptake protein [Actinomycetia bacterium]|nr:TrkA family potassium uptake protein [Actinomycetes bacterium]
MYVVIMGCGRSGSLLARKLDEEGHDVAVIDKNPVAFQVLGPDFKGKMVTGIGFDREVLIEAGIERTDAFIALSSGDNSNIVSSRVAKTTFRVPKVITRIYDPRRAEIYRGMGIPTVAPVTWGVNRIADLLFLQMTFSKDTFGNGEVELMELEIPTSLDERRLSDFEIPGEVLVASVVRLGEAFIPVPSTTLHARDLLNVVVLRSSMDKFKKMFFFA